jgi:hypothetical protein
MAAQTITNVQILYGSADLSPFTGSFEYEQSTAMESTKNVAGGGYDQFVPGLTMAKASIKGNADYATGAVEQAFIGAQRGRQDTLSIIHAGTAAVEGSSASFIRGQLASFKALMGETGKVASFDVAMESDIGQVNGVVGAPLATRTTAGFTGAGLNLGAVGTGPTGVPQRLWAAVHVTATTGSNLAVTIQSDTSGAFGAPVASLVFSTVSAVGWQFAFATGPITGPFYRVLSTVATGTFTYAVVMGIW